MGEKLLVGVLGNEDSGKSYTWNKLFSRAVRTGKKLHKLYFTDNEYAEVFLIYGSPQEREIPVGKIVRNAPPIVLCSMQYREDVIRTLKWFVDRDYFLFIHWLNPGYRDTRKMVDKLNLTRKILDEESLLGIRNGKISAKNRVREMREFIYGWAQSRNLIFTE